MAAMKPVLNREAADQKAIGLLKRIDPDIQELLATVSHVVLYRFNPEGPAWIKTDVEGTLYVVKRRGQPRFRYIVLNKTGKEDFMENIEAGFTSEVHQPYIMYRTDIDEVSSKVVGLWCHTEEECKRLGALFSRIQSLVPGHDASGAASIMLGAAPDPAEGLPEVATAPAQPTPQHAPALQQQQVPDWEARPAPAVQLLTPELLLRGAPLAAGVAAPSPTIAWPPSLTSRVEDRPRQGRDGALSDRAAVQALLRGMAKNEVLCDEFAKELRAQNLI